MQDESSNFRVLQGCDRLHQRENSAAFAATVTGSAMPVQLEVAVLAAELGGWPPAASSREPSSEGRPPLAETQCRDQIQARQRHEDGACRFRLAGRQARNP